MTSSSNPAEMMRGLKAPWDADRVGVFASVLCAIHCAATPFLLILLPTFGKIWAHPASHWGMALIVVPIAAFMISKGYKRHGRKWIVAVGILGILFVLAGAVAPYLEKDGGLSPQASASASGSSSAMADGEEAGCTDSCCPSVVVQEDGSSSLHVPLASILTTIGGVFLIATHIGNLSRCPCCDEDGVIA